jgi:hypothetical protein
MSTRNCFGPLFNEYSCFFRAGIFAMVTVSPTSGHITDEFGGTAVFTVVLNAKPTSFVTIAASSSDTSEGTLPSTPLVFSTSNWNTGRSVTMTGVEDDVVDGDTAYGVTLSAASSDVNFHSVSVDSVVGITNLEGNLVFFGWFVVGPAKHTKSTHTHKYKHMQTHHTHTPLTHMYKYTHHIQVQTLPLLII